MAAADRIRDEVSPFLNKPPDLLAGLNKWIDQLRDYHIVAHYFSINPDKRRSPDSLFTLSVLTDVGFHTIDIRSNKTGLYTYCPLNQIEWITEYETKERDYYIIRLQIPKTTIFISDSVARKAGLQDFAQQIRRKIEGV